MNDKILLIVGMMMVTYIPRLIPFILVSDKELPEKLKKFLKVIPYTALGALIIPGVFSAIPGMPQAAIVGIGFAMVYGWYKGGIIVPVLGSIAVALLMLMIGNEFAFQLIRS